MGGLLGISLLPAAGRSEGLGQAESCSKQSLNLSIYSMLYIVFLCLFPQFQPLQRGGFSQLRLGWPVKIGMTFSVSAASLNKT